MNAAHLIYCPLASRSRPRITSRKRGGSEGRLSHIHGSPAIAKSSKRTGFLIKRPQKHTHPQIYVKSAPPLNGSTQTLKIMRPRRTRTPTNVIVKKICHRCSVWPATCLQSPDSCERTREQNRDDGVITYGRIIQPRADGAMRRVRIKRAPTVTLRRRAK